MYLDIKREFQKEIKNLSDEEKEKMDMHDLERKVDKLQDNVKETEKAIEEVNNCMKNVKSCFDGDFGKFESLKKEVEKYVYEKIRDKLRFN